MIYSSHNYTFDLENDSLKQFGFNNPYEILVFVLGLFQARDHAIRVLKVDPVS